MNIKCNYCGSEFDETLEKCPNCGASNANVKRSVIDQPKTIEELKEWYSARGLPPYETTRFFIGIDYKGPRAFGIYKDENSGKCVVYKNKDTGVRAVRYEGTDEAYAVNELFMRLKQEILEQKARNISEGTYTAPSTPQTHEEAVDSAYLQYKKEFEYKRQKRRTLLGGGIAVLAVLLVVVLAIAKGGVIRDQIPSTVKSGYYRYDDNSYYHMSESQYNNWLLYSPDSGKWEECHVEDTFLVDPKKSQKYFVSENDYDSLGCPDALESKAYLDYKNNYSVSKGYYKFNGEYYYHDEVRDNFGWYLYDADKDDWYSISYVPDSLTHQYTAKDFTYEPNWKTETSVSDYFSSDYYVSTYSEDKNSSSSGSSYSSSSHSSKSSDSSSWWDSSDDDSWSSSDSSWDWSSSDSWDSGSTDWGSDW